MHYFETLKRDGERAGLVAENLRYYHQKSGYTMRQLADAAGMSARLLEGYEAGQPSYNKIHLGRLANALGIQEVQLYMRRHQDEDLFPYD